MPDTNTRIAELLGWVCSPHAIWRFAGEPVSPHFTTDLNLTVREIERKGWKWRVGWSEDSGLLTARVWGSTSDVRRLGCRESTPHGLLARAFMAALEAEASDA